MDRIPLCHKCVNRIVSEFVIIGCKEEPKIETYTDAKIYCPVLLEIKQDERKRQPE